MRTIKSSLFLFCILLVSALARAGELTDISEGIEYQTLSNPQSVANPDKIEVIEFFSYACPHCYHLEPDVDQWLAKKTDKIEFIRIPAIFNKQWEAFARVYYTAEVFGIVDKVHGRIFDAIHGPGKKIKSIADLEAIFTEQGISPKEFEQTLTSFTVATKIQKAKAMTRKYGVDSVPMIFVQGKYKTSSSLANGHENVFKVVDYIIQHEKM